MKLSDEESLTIDEYNKSASSWSGSHSTPGFWADELKKFNELLPSGKVLEIGCGGGRDAKELIACGYDYLGTDPAENFVKEARKNNPNGNFEVKSVREIDYSEDSFDGFWASAVLLHIPKDKISESLLKINKCVRNNGIGFIAIKEGNAEEVKVETSSDGEEYKRFWAFYSKEEFSKILNNNGFELIDFIYKPVSERTKWLIFFVRIKK